VTKKCIHHQIDYRTVCYHPIWALPVLYLLCLAILLPTLRSALPVDIPTDYPPLYSACRYYNRLSVLLSLALLQSTIQFTDYPLCCLWRHSNRLCCVHYSVCRHSNRLSALLQDSDGIVSERDRATIRSALFLAILQPTICCASLLVFILD
jgi:hypothetical protein